MNPTVEGAISINLNDGNVLEEKVKIFNHKVFSRCLRAPRPTLVITACGDHVARWAVGWSTYHFPDKVHLSCGNHVANARDGVEHFPYFVIMKSLFVDFGHQYVENASDAAMKKHLKFDKFQFS